MSIRQLFKRRRILIEGFQYRLLLINFLYLSTAALIFAAVLFMPLIDRLLGPGVPELEQERIALEFLSLNARFWPALIVVFGLLAFHSIITSHRIAGPLYRFRALYKAVGDGDLSVRANLRKNDFLFKDAAALNDMVERLGEKLERIDRAQRDAELALRQLRQSAGGASPGEIHARVDELESHLEELRSALGQVRTGG